MPRLSFGFRLTLAGLITLTVILFAVQHVVSASVRETMLEENRLLYEADASFIERTLATAEPGAGVPATTRAMLAAIDQRPAVVSVELVSHDGRVVAASPRDDVGQIEAGRSVDVARRGRNYAGPETEAQDVEQEYTYLTALTGPGAKRYALEVDEDASVLDSRVSVLHTRLFVLSLLALPLAAGVFLLAGGARLLQGHNLALRRAERDPLTGLGNRRHFDERLSEEVATARSRRESLVLAVLDLDGFKAINDTYGHHRGDEALVAVASALKAGRRADSAFRLGGDEFAVLMPNIDIEGARHAMQRRAQLLAAGDSGAGMSVGMALLSAGDDTGLEMWRQADETSYVAKRLPGTTILAHGETPPGSEPRSQDPGADAALPTTVPCRG